MSSVALELFGVIHIDRPGKVTDELGEYSADADALFIEYPEVEPDWRIHLRCLLRSPAFFLGMAIVSLVQLPLFVLLNRTVEPLLSTEMRAARRVSDESGVPVHRVDAHPLFLAIQRGWQWSVLNWGLVIALVAFDAAALVTTVLTLLLPWTLVKAANRSDRRAGTFVAAVAPWSALAIGIAFDLLSLAVVLVTCLTFQAFVWRTISQRNEHMLRSVEGISKENEYERACLITGKAHLDGLVQLAEGTGVDVSRSRPNRWLRGSETEIADPEPETDDSNWLFDHPIPEKHVETNTVRRRIGAAVIDLLGIALLAFPVAIAIGIVFMLVGGRAAGVTGLEVGLVVTPLLYGFALEALFGQTVGKRCLGLVVLAEDGSQCSWKRAAVRNLLRPVDFVVFYLLGLIAIGFTRDRQRLGDLAAGTIVGRVARTEEGD